MPNDHNTPELPILPDTTFHGIQWDCVEQMVKAPKPIQSVMLNLALLLAQHETGRMTIMRAAQTLKAKEVQIEQCATYCPRLFQMERKATMISLLQPGYSPEQETPSEKKARIKAEEKKQRDERKNLESQEIDERDTPANRIRKLLQTHGITLSDARSAAHMIVRTYPEHLIIKVINEMPEDFTGSPVGYLKTMCKRHLDVELPPIPNTEQGSFPDIFNDPLNYSNLSEPAPLNLKDLRIPTPVKKWERMPAGSIRFLGWNHEINESPSGPIRMKVIRTSNGYTKLSPPLPEDTIPTLEEDPGVIVQS